MYGCDTNYAFIKKEKMKTLRREILERLVKITKIKFPKDEKEHTVFSGTNWNMIWYVEKKKATFKGTHDEL